MSKQLKVVLCWHFHQPEYREPLSNVYLQPWTYLHAIKDYVDMVAHLEANPLGRVVVNVTPLLLEQINDYCQQIDSYCTNQTTIRDPLLAALVNTVPALRIEQQEALIKQCLRANHKRLITRFPKYQYLVEMAKWMASRPSDYNYLNDQFISDLLVWYHLAWMAETERKHPLVVELTNKGGGFDLSDRLALFELVSSLLHNLLPRYKALSERNQIELSVTPYSHPIMPLLLDTKIAHQASPDLTLPAGGPFPGGEARIVQQLKKSIEVFESVFGFAPKGCWPSEGAICDHSLKLVQEAGFSWVASGGNVLKNSLGDEKRDDKRTFYRAYQLRDQSLRCFFRDDHLSDLIGFTYSDWHAQDAVANLTNALEGLHHELDLDKAVVPIILDGENAWEYYPNNGFHFLDELYRQLSVHPSIELTNFAQASNTEAAQLNHIVAGSWVYGTLTTWIGDEQKNHAWDLLCDAKRIYDKVWPTLTAIDQTRAEHQLAICEGSDWFWWFGDYNPGEVVSEFDGLFRMHLAHLYRCLHLFPPDSLAENFAHGSGSPEHGGVMRHGEF